MPAVVSRVNPAIVLFLLYCGVSSLWSDYPFVAFKRWTKALGNLIMVLVIFTEANPRFAVKQLLARGGFLLIPLSILMIKYYGELGRVYDRWTGEMSVVGVGDGKNGLGNICLVIGLGAVWNLLEEVRHERRDTRHLFVHGTLLMMVFWLLYMTNSATSLACFILGVAILIVLPLLRSNRPATLHAVLVSALALALLAFTLGDLHTVIIEALGRNTTLTGRTDLWDELLALDKAPWFGTGFESFFLGSRLKHLWSLYWWRPNEAHNGYLETYLTLGWVGFGLLATVFVTGYRNIVATFHRERALGTLQMAFFLVAAVYNWTESAFKVLHPVLIAFLIAVAAVPESDKRPSLQSGGHIPPPKERPGWRRRRFISKHVVAGSKRRDGHATSASSVSGEGPSPTRDIHA
jgi:O-antigen ligase